MSQENIQVEKEHSIQSNPLYGQALIKLMDKEGLEKDEITSLLAHPEIAPKLENLINDEINLLSHSE